MTHGELSYSDVAEGLEADAAWIEQVGIGVVNAASEVVDGNNSDTKISTPLFEASCERIADQIQVWAEGTLSEDQLHSLIVGLHIGILTSRLIEREATSIVLPEPTV
jgi:hypothetical protein